jgi:VWFA-related protein
MTADKFRVLALVACRRTLSLVAAPLLASVVGLAQTATHPVTLDVVVDGRPRAPLTAADFVVTDGGLKLAVDSARSVDASAAGAALPSITNAEEERAAASQAGRIVGIYVDEYHLPADASLAAARTAVAALVRNGLGPRDLVTVVKPLDSLLAIRLTSDREAAARLIETADGRQGDYAARNAFEQDFFAGAPARIDAARNQVALSSINALATHIGQFASGRKTLVVLSNGIAGPVRTGTALPGFDAVARAANRGRVAIYVLRPSANKPPAVAVRDQNAPADPLALLATQTTGFSIDGADRLDTALARLLHDASSYYELTLTPPPQAADGRYRPVDVGLRSAGTTIRARGGYALPMPAPVMTTPRSSIMPETSRIMRHASPLIRTWFGQSAVGDSRTRIAFVWEASPLVPGDRTARATTPARLSLKVLNPDGAEMFSGTSGPSRVDSLAPSTEITELSFEAPPGPLVLEMDILDAGGRAIDHDVRDLSVAAFRTPLSLGTIAAYRARSARDIHELQLGEDRPPVVGRQFSRAEHVVFRTLLASRAPAPSVTAKLASGFGAAIRDLPVSLVGDRHDVAQVDFALASLASGTYQVEFTARAQDASATERVQFTVTP